MVAMLAEDAAWSMPPLASWFRGLERSRLPRARPAVGRVALAPPCRASANGQPAVAGYTWDEARGTHLPFALDVLTLEGDRIRQITAFITRTDRARRLRALARGAARRAAGVRGVRAARRGRMSGNAPTRKRGLKFSGRMPIRESTSRPRGGSCRSRALSRSSRRRSGPSAAPPPGSPAPARESSTCGREPQHVVPLDRPARGHAPVDGDRRVAAERELERCTSGGMIALAVGVGEQRLVPVGEQPRGSGVSAGGSGAPAGRAARCRARRGRRRVSSRSQPPRSRAGRRPPRRRRRAGSRARRRRGSARARASPRRRARAAGAGRARSPRGAGRPSARRAEWISGSSVRAKMIGAHASSRRPS